jgi:hypothetical protein
MALRVIFSDSFGVRRDIIVCIRDIDNMGALAEPVKTSPY